MTREISISDGTTTLNFLTGVLKLKDGSWSPKTAIESIWETMELFSNSSDGDIRTAYDQLEDLLKAAREYKKSPIESTPIWITWQSEGETVKKSLVLDGTIEIISSISSGALLGRNRINLRIAIQRQWIFEAANPSAYSPGALSNTGGKATLAALGGVENGRIASLIVSSVTVAAGLYRTWIGLRPVRNGTAGFIPLWECEEGTVNDDIYHDTEIVADGEASGGYIVRVNFQTTSMAWRETIYLSDIASANFDDFVGRYLVLGRIKVDSANTQVAIQLQHGWAGFSRSSIIGTTYISGQTNWKLIELGQVQIPPTGYRGTGPGIGNGLEDYALRLFAERISAAGTLSFDCLILIPSEHLCTMNGTSIDASGGVAAAYVNPLEDDQYAIASQSNDILGNIEYSFTDWDFPPGGALLVVAAEANNIHMLTPTITPVFSVYPRWRGLRA